MSNLSQFGGGGIKSIQRGTIAITTSGNAGSGAATITSVNTAKTSISLLGFVAPSSGGTARVELTNATTVTASAATSIASGNVTVGYEVVEFY